MTGAAAKDDITAGLERAWPVPAAGSVWTDAMRADALSRFRKMGAPVKRNEYWRFTDPSGLTQVPALVAGDFRHDRKEPFGSVDAVRAVFVDGVFRADLSDDLVAEGFEITLLWQALGAEQHWARSLFGRLEARGQKPVPRPLAALNTAFATEGLAIRVIGRPVRALNLVYRHQDPRSDAMIRVLLRLEEGAEATILENGPGAARLNTCMEVEVSDRASLHHIRLQGRDHGRRTMTSIFARLGSKSQMRSFSLGMNGALTRNETVAELVGDGARLHLAGACIGEGDFHHDDTVFVTHDALNCQSRQVFKKVLRNGAVGVFQGKILVRPGAQKTDGYQISQGLLLDEGSQFLAKPELEIHADDVACSHGSTCGAVDQTALFYLTSRGVPRADAEAMLVLAFLDQAIAEIDNPALAADMRERVARWLRRHG